MTKKKPVRNQFGRLPRNTEPHPPQCSMHDVPEEEIAKRIHDMIKQNIEGPHKFHMMGIFADDNKPSFVYTIGVTDILGFELLAVGLPQQPIGRLFNNIVGIKAVLEFGKDDNRWSDRFPARFYKCGDPRIREFVVQADNWYHQDVDVVQLVLPDDKGKFFCDEGYDAEMMKPQWVLV